MPYTHIFEYAVIRVVPRVEREEFMNVGVVLLCNKLGFLQTRWHLDADRLRAFACYAPDVEELITDIRARLDAFERVCAGGPGGGPIGQLPAASRFRWLTAARSTLLQTSPLHPGLCDDPAATLEKLFVDLVS